MEIRLIGLLLSLALCVSAAYPEDSPDRYQLRQFAEELGDLRFKLKLPGMAAAIVKDGKVVWALELAWTPARSVEGERCPTGRVGLFKPTGVPG